MLASCLVGLHLLTQHVGPSASEYRTDTPGVYVRCPSGLTAGVLSNSIGRAGAYLAYTTSVGPIDLTAGGIAGYRGAAIRPLLTASYSVPLTSSSAMRLTLLPRPRQGGAGGLHFSVEWRQH